MNDGSINYRFGDFEFDSASRTLCQKGRIVKLQAQPATLLEALLRRADKVVSREELIKEIWVDGTFVDFDKGLNFCIAQVRQVLRDDASRPLFIRTIPKHGYQFIAPVNLITSGQDRTPAHPSAPRTAFPRWTRFVVPAIGLIGFALVAVMHHLHGAASRDIPNLAVVRFDADTDTAPAKALATSLTDDVIVQLTAGSNRRYRVIGNADILREPREKRNLQSIASSLQCGYVVLGQVQSDGSKVLILAHLIRLSDYTHISVVRIERNLESPQTLESEAASQIAATFATKMADRPAKAALFVAASN